MWAKYLQNIWQGWSPTVDSVPFRRIMWLKPEETRHLGNPTIDLFKQTRGSVACGRTTRSCITPLDPSLNITFLWGTKHWKTRLINNSTTGLVGIGREDLATFSFPHSQLCRSSPKCMLLTCEAPFEKEIDFKQAFQGFRVSSWSKEVNPFLDFPEHITCVYSCNCSYCYCYYDCCCYCQTPLHGHINPSEVRLLRCVGSPPTDSTRCPPARPEEEAGAAEGGWVSRGEDPTPAAPKRGDKRQRDAAEVWRGRNIQTSRAAAHVSSSLAEDG